MSKIGIKALSIIGAPIFAVIAGLISVSMGTILGSISSVVFSILGIVLLFALPIGVGLLIYFLISGSGSESDSENGNLELNFNRTGPLYMLLSILSNSLQGNTD